MTGTGKVALCSHRRLFGLWVVFFLMCLGLGYSTVNRYSPAGNRGTADSREYARMVRGDMRRADSPFRYRVLVPALARPIYILCRGRLGSWDPVFVGLLVVNSAFCALTALMIYLLGCEVSRCTGTPLIGSLLYLLNFVTVNVLLCGLVDSAEGALFAVLTWAVVTERWSLLPALAIVGCLGRETFLVYAVVFVVVWILRSGLDRETRIRRLGWTVGMFAMGASVVAGLHLLMSGPVVDRYYSREFGSPLVLLKQIGDCIWSRNLLFAFGWLLPLAWPRLRTFPRPWLWGCGAAAAVALLMGGYANIGGTVDRALFDVSSPLLVLSAVRWLTPSLLTSGSDGKDRGDAAGPR